MTDLSSAIADHYANQRQAALEEAAPFVPDPELEAMAAAMADGTGGTWPQLEVARVQAYKNRQRLHAAALDHPDTDTAA